MKDKHVRRGASLLIRGLSRLYFIIATTNPSSLNLTKLFPMLIFLEPFRPQGLSLLALLQLGIYRISGIWYKVQSGKMCLVNGYLTLVLMEEGEGG